MEVIMVTSQFPNVRAQKPAISIFIMKKHVRADPYFKRFLANVTDYTSRSKLY